MCYPIKVRSSPFHHWFHVYPIVLVSLGLAMASYDLLAQGQTGIVPLVTNDPVTEYLTRGGLVSLIGLILFFYRRDYLKVLNAKDDAMDVMTRMVESQTRAATESAIALNASTMIIAANTQALQRLAERLDNTRGKSAGA